MWRRFQSTPYSTPPVLPALTLLLLATPGERKAALNLQSVSCELQVWHPVPSAAHFSARELKGHVYPSHLPTDSSGHMT